MATKTTETLFDRAAAAAEDGSSAECAKLTRELNALIEDEAPEREASRPPMPEMRYRGDGGAYSVTGDPGADYRAAAERGDEKALQKLAARSAMLDTRHTRAVELLDALKERQKAAQEEEALAAAPAKAKELVKAIPEALDRLEDAAAALSAAQTELAAMNRDLQQQRELAGEDSASLDVLTFRRLGLALAYRLDQREDLFGSFELALKAARAILPPPQPGLIERIRRRLNFSGNTDSFRKPASEAAVDSDLGVWWRERLKLITAGEIEAAEALEPTDPNLPGRRRRFAPAGK